MGTAFPPATRSKYLESIPFLEAGLILDVI